MKIPGHHVSSLLRTVVLAGALATALTVTGCERSSSTAAPTPSAGAKFAPSLVAMMKQAATRKNLSAFERQVLDRSIRSGTIADADYEEAHSRYARCVKDAGYTEKYKKLPNGVYQVQFVPPRDSDNAYAKAWFDASGNCAHGTLAMVESLFTLQQGNPDLLANPREVVVRCLVQEGLAPAGYTVATFDKDNDDSFKNAPYKVTDIKAQTCFSNAGMAVGAR